MIEHTFGYFKLVYVCKMEWLIKNIRFFFMASLTLGLAPFTPPHIWGKLQWIAGGGAFSGDNPMASKDVFDLVMHGAPWVLLIAASIAYVIKMAKKTKA